MQLKPAFSVKKSRRFTLWNGQPRNCGPEKRGRNRQFRFRTRRMRFAAAQAGGVERSYFSAAIAAWAAASRAIGTRKGLQET